MHISCTACYPNRTINESTDGNSFTILSTLWLSLPRFSVTLAVHLSSQTNPRFTAKRHVCGFYSFFKHHMEVSVRKIQSCFTTVTHTCLVRIWMRMHKFYPISCDDANTPICRVSRTKEFLRDVSNIAPIYSTFSSARAFHVIFYCLE